MRTGERAGLYRARAAAGWTPFLDPPAYTAPRSARPAAPGRVVVTGRELAVYSIGSRRWPVIPAEPARYYGQDQIKAILPYLTFTPRWLLLGGPADGNEAQAARLLWPGCRVVACEPNPEPFRWQLEHGGLDEGVTLLNVALSDRAVPVEMMREPGRVRNASAHRTTPEGNRDNPEAVFWSAPAVTWDELDAGYGPFGDAVVWLDLEGSELPAVRGAAGLFARGAVRAVNVEASAQCAAENVEVARLLTGYGFHKAGRWNDSATCEDQIWVR